MITEVGLVRVSIARHELCLKFAGDKATADPKTGYKTTAMTADVTTDNMVVITDGTDNVTIQADDEYASVQISLTRDVIKMLQESLD